MAVDLSFLGTQTTPTPSTPPKRGVDLSFLGVNAVTKPQEDISQGESALTGVLKGLLPGAATVAAATTAAEMAAPTLNPYYWRCCPFSRWCSSPWY
jgi:hypothetical protein